jgi:DNA replication licensing factor MCM2
LPPSSPPPAFSDTDESADDRDAVRDMDDEEDEDGEDLFADAMNE